MSIYFDHNATSPPEAEAVEAWLRATRDRWHNPSSLYREAGWASQALEMARERLAGLLEVESERLVFLSSATEANNTLFAGWARCFGPTDCVAISAVEHPSVREAARACFGRERVVEIPVTGEGVATVPALEQVLSGSQIAAVSVMAANNESGVLQPWAELSRVCRERGVRFHTDASQWIGRLPCAAFADCDYVTGSGHKWGGVKGAAFLMLADEGECFPLLHGGPQEKGRRAGTEDYAAVEAMVTALETRAVSEAASQVAQRQCRNAFEKALKAKFPGLRVISEGAERLGNTSLLVMPEFSNLKWLTRLSRRGFAISTGSACSSGREGASVVVQALGADWDELKRVLRVSSGPMTSPQEWQALLAAFLEVREDLQNEAAQRNSNKV